MKNLLTILKNFGLSDKEAKAYLALLDLDSAKVSEVAKQSGINRSSAYVVLEILRKRGLAGVSSDQKVRRYIAAVPETLLQTARALAHKHQGIKEDIESAMPEFKALAKSTKRRPVVQVFEGKEGVMNAFEDSLKTKEKFVRVASSGDRIMENLPDYFPGRVQKRVKSGAKVYGIHPDDKAASFLLNISSKSDKHILIPPHKYKLPADIGVYDNKTRLISFNKGMVAIIIEDKEIADVMKSLFDLAFETAKRLSNNTKAAESKSKKRRN